MYAMVLFSQPLDSFIVGYILKHAFCMPFTASTRPPLMLSKWLASLALV